MLVMLVLDTLSAAEPNRSVLISLAPSRVQPSSVWFYQNVFFMYLQGLLLKNSWLESHIMLFVFSNIIIYKIGYELKNVKSWVMGMCRLYMFKISHKKLKVKNSES